MSDGDWGERRSSWLVRAVFAALVVLILLAASGGIYGYTKQISYEQAAHNNAQEYARYTSAKAGQACALLPSSQQPKCFADAEGEQDNQAREKRREYDDLVAQQTSALWTNIMGLAAVTGMILSVIGVWLIYATFRETKRTANEAKRSADAFIAAERGWLKCTFQSYRKRNESGVLVVQLRGDAIGKAQIEIREIRWGILNSVTFPRHFDWSFSKPEVRTFSPDAERRSGWPFFALEVPVQPAILGGWVAYTTQFPGEMRTYFLLQLDEFPSHNGGEMVFSARPIERQGWPQNT